MQVFMYVPLTSQHSAALGAHEAAYCHVEVGGASLFTVKALFVGWVLSLDLPHCQTELVILLHLPHVGNFGHFQAVNIIAHAQDVATIYKSANLYIFGLETHFLF